MAGKFLCRAVRGWLWLERVAKQSAGRVVVVAAISFAVLFAVLAYDAHPGKSAVASSPLEWAKFYAYLAGGALLALQVWISNRRTSALEKTTRIGAQSHLTERFKNAVGYLRDASEAVRIGGIYTLRDIAWESKDYGAPVYEILRAKLREIVLAPGYAGEIRGRLADAGGAGLEVRRAICPSGEVAAILDVFFPFTVREVSPEKDPRTGSYSLPPWRAHRGAFPEKHPFFGMDIDLSGMPLQGVDLSGRYLGRIIAFGANMEGAILSGCFLVGADLTGAILKNADLSGAQLESTRMGGANFANAQCNGANFRWASLAGADFSGALVGNADFAEVVAKDAKFDEMSNDEGRMNFSDANLSRASFRNAEFPSMSVACVFKGAMLDGVDFSGARISAHNLFEARSLFGAKLSDDIWEEVRQLNPELVERSQRHKRG